MEYTNVRYSITLNDAQISYLADESQEISRMKCLATFLRMAVKEPRRETRKNFSIFLYTGQFMASKVELAEAWGCDRKTATRIIREFNQMDILSSEASNRTTVHTLKCLSVWFTDQGTVKNRFFTINPEVRSIAKPVNNARRVPPEEAPGNVPEGSSECHQTSM
jgi:hypothetical protein